MPRISSKTVSQYLPDLFSDQGSSTSTTSASSAAYSKLAAKKYVKDNDKNKDGLLTKDEVTLSQEAFDRLDKDKSKGLSQEEMQAGLSGSEEELGNYFAKGNTKLMKATLMSSLFKYV